MVTRATGARWPYLTVTAPPVSRSPRTVSSPCGALRAGAGRAADGRALRRAAAAAENPADHGTHAGADANLGGVALGVAFTLDGDERSD